MPLVTLAPVPYAAASRVVVTGDWKEAAMVKTRNELNQDPLSLESSLNLSARLLSTDEVARLLVVPVTTLCTWRYKGTGPKAFKVGKHLRYRVVDVLTWLEQQAK
jgi:predicted DNA-binding transcriptional regulator AlpA